MSQSSHRAWRTSGRKMRQDGSKEVQLGVPCWNSCSATAAVKWKLWIQDDSGSAMFLAQMYMNFGIQSSLCPMSKWSSEGPIQSQPDSTGLRWPSSAYGISKSKWSSNAPQCFAKTSWERNASHFRHFSTQWLGSSVLEVSWFNLFSKQFGLQKYSWVIKLVTKCREFLTSYPSWARTTERQSQSVLISAGQRSKPLSTSDQYMQNQDIRMVSPTSVKSHGVAKPKPLKLW